ncbi:NAD dependent epimerase/dehydratase family protein [Sarocladium implicatum]|nr:NAD dependent epimerase/dehydratase family protein [Sarocladium implicatum]
MASPSPTLMFGATGLTGAHILSTLLASNPSTPITTISRRQPSATSPNLTARLESDTTKWASAISSLDPRPDTVVSALGTTRAQAGGIANQWKIDHDLNVELAKAAKEAGAKTFVFVSSGGTRGLLSSSVPYSKMKNGVEDTIRDLGFEQAIILRPGALLGDRDQDRAGQGFMNSMFRNLDMVGLKDKFAVESDVVGRAATAAIKQAAEGKAPSKYWVVEQPDVIRLGRTEWREDASSQSVADTPAQ